MYIIMLRVFSEWTTYHIIVYGVTEVYGVNRYTPWKSSLVKDSWPTSCRWVGRGVYTRRNMQKKRGKGGTKEQ